jgi:hypothetical protein
LLSFPELAAKKPWSTPMVEEVPWDTLPTEMRMLVLGLPDAGLPPQVDAVADVPDQAEKAPPAADVIDEAEKARREAAMEKMLPGDRRRAEIRARNQEVVERENAKMRAGLH